MTRLVTFGEAMASLTTTQVGPLSHTSTLQLSMAGAESNVAIAAARLGLDAVWIGKVGDDELGRLVLRELRAEGVDVTWVGVDPSAPTGLMLKERRSSERTSVLYYRSGSAGSRLGPEDVRPDAIAGAALLHCTGVTPALSDSARDATFAAVAAARAAQIPVSFDPNHRSRLWSAERATAVYQQLVRQADIVLATAEEAAMILGAAAEPPALARGLAALGPRQVVIKLGEAGAVASAHGRELSTPARRAQVVDPVGAGDAFDAGYLTAILEGREPAEAMDVGATLGAHAVGVAGDWEGLPLRRDLEDLAGGPGTVTR